jgi:two-component system NtrC family sensor kinase
MPIKLSTYSLKTGILFTLVLILASAMILLDIVMIRMTEKDMLQAEMRKGEIIIQSIAQNMATGVERQTHGGNEKWYPLNEDLSAFLAEAHLSGALIIDCSGKILFETETGKKERALLLTHARKALIHQKETLSIPPIKWWILPFRTGDLYMASPLRRGTQTIGIASIKIPLISLYRAIRQTQKIVFFYILLNTLILALLGYYFLHRSIIRPINRLVERAEEFKEGETFLLSSPTRQNEFGKLSRALNMMLRGLEESKVELKTSVSSLEKANVELQQAQEEIIRSEKLASIGRLASGVAHEIGNPIGIVLGYLDLLKENELGNEDRRDIIDRIGAEVERVNRTIRNLLDFSRPSKGEAKAISVHHTIGDMLDMLKPQPMMADIEITLDQRTEHDTVLADPDKLKQVFLNIAMNAIDAMGAGQTRNGSPHKMLLIKTWLESEPGAGKKGKARGLCIAFVDNGPGIPIEDLNRVFDPFYTTKEPGKGTGLGLSVSLRIIEDMGGDIKPSIEHGRGTTMTVILPLYEG